VHLPWRLRRRRLFDSGALTRGVHSQYGQDRFVAALLGTRRGGTFVDVGAYDGRAYSNTLYLEEQLAWSGLCIEPNPTSFARLRESRTTPAVNVAIADTDGEAPFTTFDGYGEMLSGLTTTLKREAQIVARDRDLHAAEITVPVRRLDGVLTSHRIDHVDYVSIDVEGGELGVLAGFDPAGYGVEVITCEIDGPDRRRIERRLAELGFRLRAVLASDGVFVRDR
jgi:FkbM family methyltransferase